MPPAATENVTTGGNTTSYPMEAGTQHIRVPSSPGAVNASLTRNGATQVSGSGGESTLSVIRKENLDTVALASLGP
ncbi:MAG TPA: hypothetical protein VGS41_13720 [Chthonomonadales bacterium]|nr:hypothetical protein [Chthonomonadales bacterium]